jgi:cystathionine beta-lyase/cystathionine gamma-synthase
VSRLNISVNRDPYTLRTAAVHSGIRPDPITGSIAPDIVVSSNYATKYGQIGFSAAGTNDEDVSYAYAREGHPNARQLEDKLMALEASEDAAVFATGIAAITGLLFQLLSPGDHLVLSDISYAGTAEFVRGLFQRKGIDFTVADLSDLDDLKRAMNANTKVVYAESPCNPILKLVDLQAAADITHGGGAKLIVDSTFATPVATRPIQLGADYVVHSLTKYLCGHGDAMGGAIVGRQHDIKSLRNEIGTHLGASLSPFACWLILRGIETLPVRMAAYEDSATKVAEFLEEHSQVTRVIYPGLPSHPQHELAQKQMANFSGMISFHVKNPHAFGRALSKTAKHLLYATSLGSNRSLLLFCDTGDLQRTTFQLDAEHLRRYRDWAGDGFFRLSVGLEDPKDICSDLDRALFEMAES